MSLARDLIDRIFHPDRDVHAIPVLDGGFSPNQRLEQAALLAAFDAPDAAVVGTDGRLYVSSGTAVFVCAGPRFDDRRVLADVGAPAGALAVAPDGRLLVCVAGRGVCALDAVGAVAGWLEAAGGAPIRCPTAVAVAADGTIFVTDGSRHNRSDQWLQDLMQGRPGSGRLIAAGRDLADARVLADGLAWPAGVAVTHDEAGLFVSEAWTHRLSLFPRGGGKARVLVKNFAGYPCRISRGRHADYWLAFFALRTQLTEFVLREDGFRRKMMAVVEPDLWIGPSLGGRFDYREPTQIGRIKKLGIQKPWAPARSYGLVARLDEGGAALESLHSRAAGTLHGVTAAIEHEGRLLVVSKGHGRLAEAPLGRPN